jgi:hypothetical protein
LDDGRAPKIGAGTPSLDELDALLAKPDDWPALGPDLLRHLVFYECLSYGVDPEDDEVPRVTALARLAVGRLNPAVRREVVLQVARAVERLHREHEIRDGAGYTNGLLPFVVEDPDPSVVAAAACEMAILLPLEQGDPMSGPKYVASFIAELDRDDARAGIVAGLLSLGDKRVDALVARAWRHLGDEGRQSLALLIQAVPGLHVGTVKFLLDWLEDEALNPATASFGIVAGTMARAGLQAADHGVADVVRAFPVIAAPEGKPFRVMRTWSREELQPILRRRLDRLASADRPSELIASVLRSWGLGTGEPRG